MKKENALSTVLFNERSVQRANEVKNETIITKSNVLYTYQNTVRHCEYHSQRGTECILYAAEYQRLVEFTRVLDEACLMELVQNLM